MSLRNASEPDPSPTGVRATKRDFSPTTEMSAIEQSPLERDCLAILREVADEHPDDPDCESDEAKEKSFLKNFIYLIKSMGDLEECHIHLD